MSHGNDVRNLDSYTLAVFAKSNLDLVYYKETRLVLRLPGERIFEDSVDSLTCRKGADGNIGSISVDLPSVTIEEIERTGNRLIKYWNFERGNFDDWCRERRGRIPEDDERLGMDKNFKSVCQDGARPHLYMEILHYQDDRWRLTWKAYWAPDDAK